MKKEMHFIQKTTVLFTLILSITISHFACAVPRNCIKETGVAEREKQLTLYGDKQFVYDFNLSSKYTKVTIKMEEYCGGNKSDFPSVSLDVKNRGTMTFTLFQPTGREGVLPAGYSMSAKSAGGISTSSVLLKNNAGTDLKTSAESNASGEIPIPESGIIVLAVMVYTGGGSISLLPEENYIDPEKSKELLKDYPLAYILRCEFSKEMPKQEE